MTNNDIGQCIAGLDQQIPEFVNDILQRDSHKYHGTTISVTWLAANIEADLYCRLHLSAETH
jgi:hypothetical protein